MKRVLLPFMLLSLLSLINSCSSSKKKNNVTQEDIESSLDIDEQTKEQFEVQKVEDVSKPLPKKPTPISKTTKTETKKKQEPKIEDKGPVYPELYKKYDRQFVKTWRAFNPRFIKIGEKINMRVSYIGLGMGSIKLETKPDVVVGKKKAYAFAARLQTAPFYSYIYELDDTLSTYVTKKDFLPLRYELIQRETKKEIDDIQLFDQEKKMLYYRYRRWRKDKKTLTKRKDDIFIPKYAIDPFSLLYFVRGLPLRVGKSFSFPIVTRNKLWVIKILVRRKEKIKTIHGKRDTYKVTAEIGEEGSFIKKGAIELWFDTAPGHMLWRMRVGTKIGSLYANIDEIE